ncbi:5924_t:CDS:2 [Dentiscutata erythropus]|uniref:5924_t:CDS:1 n=1 Tax=Dentiscutata erythropus TaxID=1348616 RepID=A0A9N9P2V6_9GLOM|nr:5924_t:CDS:2 [Dentiscutata erythropus]
MASIKVLHGSIARRFTVPNDTTWSSFESQIRSLFYIPSQTPISLSYTDEDGDIITLSSDLELQEILSDQELFGSSVKFVLSTPDELDHNEKNSWVLEGSTSQIKDEEFSKSIKDNDVISFSSSDEEDGLETSHESQEQSSNESQQQPFVFTESSEFQKNSNYKHVTVTDEETEEPTFKPTIEEKSKELPEKEEKQPESDQSTDNNNEENIFWIYNKYPHSDVLFNDYSPYYDYYSSYCRYSPFRHSRIHRPFGARRHCPISVAFYKFIKFVLVMSLITTIAKSLFFMICPLLKILFLVFALKYLKNSCHNHDDDEEKFGSWNGFGFRRRFGRCHNRRFNRNNQCCQRRESCNGNISEEVVAEKVKTLRDMGFEGENFEELVRLYNGNIDFAVEALLQQ